MRFGFNPFVLSKVFLTYYKRGSALFSLVFSTVFSSLSCSIDFFICKLPLIYFCMNNLIEWSYIYRLCYSYKEFQKYIKLYYYFCLVDDESRVTESCWPNRKIKLKCWRYLLGNGWNARWLIRNHLVFVFMQLSYL